MGRLGLLIIIVLKGSPQNGKLMGRRRARGIRDVVVYPELWLRCRTVSTYSTDEGLKEGGRVIDKGGVARRADLYLAILLAVGVDGGELFRRHRWFGKDRCRCNNSPMSLARVLNYIGLLGIISLAIVPQSQVPLPSHLSRPSLHSPRCLGPSRGRLMRSPSPCLRPALL